MQENPNLPKYRKIHYHIGQGKKLSQQVEFSAESNGFGKKSEVGQNQKYSNSKKTNGKRLVWKCTWPISSFERWTIDSLYNRQALSDEKENNLTCRRIQTYQNIARFIVT